MSDDAKAAVVLTTRLGDSSRPSLPPGLWHRLVTTLADHGTGPAGVFLDTPPVDDDLAERVRTLTTDATRVMVELDQLMSRGIWVVTEFDDAYPDGYRRLEQAAPPVLFGAGDRHLLAGGGVGIVGSRDIGEEGARVAEAVAAAAVALGRQVVSGAARGVDQLAMNEAFRRSGRVVGVLADALDRKLRSSDMLQALDQDTVCLVTQQHPSAGFSPAAAYGRNKLIYALGDVTVVIASAEGEGGTWQGAKEALGKGLPVAVWRGSGEGPGNAGLESAGARPLRDPGDLGPFLEETPQAPEQLSMI